MQSSSVGSVCRNGVDLHALTSRPGCPPVMTMLLDAIFVGRLAEEEHLKRRLRRHAGGVDLDVVEAEQRGLTDVFAPALLAADELAARSRRVAHERVRLRLLRSPNHVVHDDGQGRVLRGHVELCRSIRSPR